MSSQTMATKTALVYCSEDTKRRTRALKRGGETFDDLLARLAAAYEPEGGDQNSEVSHE